MEFHEVLLKIFMKNKIPRNTGNHLCHCRSSFTLVPSFWLEVTNGIPLSPTFSTHMLHYIHSHPLVVKRHTHTCRSVRLNGWTSSHTCHQGDDYKDKHVQWVTYPELAAVLHCFRMFAWGWKRTTKKERKKKVRKLEDVLLDDDTTLHWSGLL